MGFLNNNLLKEFSGSGVVQSLASPAVVGTGIAGATALGIYQLLKERKQEQSSNAYGPTSPTLPGKFEQISETSKIYGISRPAASLYQQGYLRSAMQGARSPAEVSVRIQTSQFKASVEMLKELSTIRKAFGMDFTLDYSEKIQKDASWLEKTAKGAGAVHRGVQAIPGVTNIEDLTKVVLKIAKIPYSISKLPVNFLDTFVTKMKGFLSGGLLYAQSDEGLAKKSGRVLKDFVKDGGLAEGISGTIHELQKANLFHSKILQVLERTGGFTTGKKDIEQLIKQGQQVYNPYTGEFVSRKQYTASRETAIRDAFMSSFRGIAGDWFSFRQKGETGLQKDIRRGKQAYLSFTNLNDEVGNYFGRVPKGQPGYKEYIDRIHRYLNIRDTILPESEAFHRAKLKYGEEERIQKPEPPVAGIENSRGVIAGRERVGLRQTSTAERKHKFLTGTLGVGALATGGLAAGGMIGGTLGALAGPIGILGGMGLAGIAAYKGRQKGKESTLERRAEETGIEFVNVVTDLNDTLLKSDILPGGGKDIGGSPSPGNTIIPGKLLVGDFGRNTPVLQALGSVETQTVGIYKGVGSIVDILKNSSSVLWEHDNWKNLKSIAKDIKGVFGGTTSVMTEEERIEKYDNVQKLQSKKLGGIVTGSTGEEVPIRAHAGELVLPSGLSDQFTTFFKDRVFGQNKQTQSFALGGPVVGSNDIKSQILNSEDKKLELAKKETAENVADATGEAGSKVPAIRKPSIYAYLREMWEVTTGKKKKDEDSDSDSGILGGALGGAAAATVANALPGGPGGKGGKKSLIQRIFGKNGIFGTLGAVAVGSFLKDLFLGNKEKGKKGLLRRIFFGKEGKKGFFKSMMPTLGKGGALLGSFFAGWNLSEGWQNAEHITQTKNPSFLQKMGAAAANVFSAATNGLVSPQELYNLDKNVTNMVSDGFSKVFDIPESLTDMGNKMLSGISIPYNWNHAEKITKDPDSNFFQKVGAVASGIGSFATFGTVKPETIYTGMTAPLKLMDTGIKSMLGVTIWKDIEGFTAEIYNESIGNRISKLTGPNPGVFQTLGASFAVMSNFFFGSGDQWAYDQMAGAFKGFDTPFIEAYKGLGDLTKFIKNINIDNFLKGILGDKYPVYKSVVDFAETTWGYIKQADRKATAIVTRAPTYNKNDPYGSLLPPPKKSQESVIPKKSPAFLEEFFKHQEQRKDTLGGALREIGDKLTSGAKEVGSVATAVGGTAKQMLVDEPINSITGKKRPVSERPTPIPEEDQVHIPGKIASTVGGLGGYISGKYNSARDYLFGSKYQQLDLSADKLQMAEIIKKASKDQNFSNLPYLLAVAEQESSLNPSIVSSAGRTGLFQMGKAAWFDAYGMKSSSMSRKDPYLNTVGAIKLHERYKNNKIPKGLQDQETAWYMLHFLGSGDASIFLNALMDNPNEKLNNIGLSNLPSILSHTANAAHMSENSKLSEVYSSLSETLGKASQRVGTKNVFSNDSFSGSGSGFFNLPNKLKDLATKAKDKATEFKKGGTIPGFDIGGVTGSNKIVNETDPVPSKDLKVIPRLPKADPEEDSVMVAAQPGELIIPKKLSGNLIAFFKRIIRDQHYTGFSGKTMSQFAQHGMLTQQEKADNIAKNNWRLIKSHEKELSEASDWSDITHLNTLEVAFKETGKSPKEYIKNRELLAKIRKKNALTPSQTFQKGFNQVFGPKGALSTSKIGGMDIGGMAANVMSGGLPGKLKNAAESINRLINRETIGEFGNKMHSELSVPFGEMYDAGKPLADALTAQQIQVDNQIRSKRTKDEMAEPGNGFLNKIAGYNKDRERQQVDPEKAITSAANRANKKNEELQNKKDSSLVIKGPTTQGSNPIKSKYELPLDPIMIGIMGNFLTGTLNYFDRAIHDAFVFGGDGLTGHGQLT